MIPVAFNAATAYLLDDQPDWSIALTVEATLPNSYERGLSGRETRRATGDTLRLALKYSAKLTSLTAITNLRNSLQAASVENILCPLWVAGFVAGATPPVTAAYYALFNADGSFASIQPAAALPFASFAYPLMIGTLKGNEPQMLAGGVMTMAYDFFENGIYPLTPAAFAAPAGLAAASGARPLFPFLAEWTTKPGSGDSEQDIARQQIGNLRTLANSYYTQRGRRTVKQSFVLQNFDAFNLLRFFSDMGGEQNNFWLGAALTEANLAVNLGAADGTMTVDNGAALGTNSFILLGDGINRVPLAVSGVAGNVWTLGTASGTAFKVGSTTIESLVLARFDLLKLTLNFSSPNLARTELKFKELPWETNAVAGETINVTQGALPTTALLFTFSQTTPTGTTYWRLTNFERDLTNGGNTWTSAPIECGDITETASLERTTVNLKSRNFAGNPLALLMPFALEWPLLVEIIEADVAANAASNLRSYFYGEVGGAIAEPPFIESDCATLTSIFDRQIPRRLYQRTDNWILFEPANGLVPANWQWNAVVVSYDAPSGVLVVGTITSTNAAALTAHFFALGYLIVTTAGAKQVRMISDNTLPAAGQMTINLSVPLTNAPSVGDVVNLFAGYDGQAATCISKFNNYSHFGGFPFMPVGNPSVLRISQPTGGGKK